MTHILSTAAYQTLTNAGFAVREHLMGMTVVGLDATKNGHTVTVRHVDNGWYPVERVQAAIATAAR